VELELRGKGSLTELAAELQKHRGVIDVPAIDQTAGNY
jgi:hypothetical protein